MVRAQDEGPRRPMGRHDALTFGAETRSRQEVSLEVSNGNAATQGPVTGTVHTVHGGWDRHYTAQQDGRVPSQEKVDQCGQ